MKKNKNIILVPTDFSKSANNALQYAIDSAKDHNAKIIALHVYKTVFSIRNKYGTLLPENESITKKKSDAKLEKLCLRMIKSRNSTCDYEVMSVFGSPSAMILKTINKVKPVFVVMGIKKTKKIAETVLGERAIKVSENAKYPIIALRENIKYKKINNITFATDYHASDVTAIKNLTEQSKSTKKEIVVLHISDGELNHDFEEKMLENFTDKIRKEVNYDNITFKLVVGKDIKSELEKYVKNKTTDMFALSTSSHRWFERLFGNSTTSKILHQSKVPLITYHNKGKRDNLYLQKKMKHEKIF